ncbi:MAG: flagellar hook-basal body complex protein FliE [Proteobacteria bacterium]|nr:flagellar hook-basal body complex protein FliE [Pseudomonadota bacterium]
MEIKGLGMSEQLRMIKGVESIIPKRMEGLDDIKGTSKPGAPSFADYLVNQLEEVNKDGLNAEKAIQRSVMGEDVNPHDTMIAVQKADISLSLLMSVKERIERAYQELIKMPV